MFVLNPKSVKKYIQKCKDKRNLNKTLKKLQLNPKNNMYYDRYLEVMEFFGDVPPNVKKTWNNKIKYENRSKSGKSADMSSDKNVIDSYVRSAKNYSARLMLAYTRYEKAYKLVSFFNEIYNKEERKNVKILDYGCGAADYAVMFAHFGYKVTLCDIEGGNLDFASFRLKKRDIEHSIIPVTLNNLYPDFGEQDIIIASEILEHVRDPLLVVKNIYNVLTSNGYLWVSSYPYQEKHTGGGHLQEAADMRLDVLNYLNENFEMSGNIKYILRK